MRCQRTTYWLFTNIALCSDICFAAYHIKKEMQGVCFPNGKTWPNYKICCSVMCRSNVQIELANKSVSSISIFCGKLLVCFPRQIVFYVFPPTMPRKSMKRIPIIKNRNPIFPLLLIDIRPSLCNQEILQP